MVQVEPNLTLTLEQLGPSGVALPAEKKAALSCSLPVKKAEAGLNTLHLWGCITARNGKDYLIAQGTCRSAGVNGGLGLVHRFYCSQDACKWADLPKVTEIKAEIALRLKSELSGDPAKLYVVKEPNPDAPPPPEDGEEADPEAESKRFIVHEISELDRLGVMIDQIQAATNVAPLGSQVVNAEGTLVPNKLFSGLDYPMRLESFVHLQGGCEGPTLAADVRGTWTLRYDGFCGLTLCRSLLYPGYSFYYNNNDCSWGGLYSGNGLKNDDLIFML